ncbi:hypothetical protein CEUSTIGMA_g13744.t1 [Chlamydomonas eustigma]|uniref:dUTP diphosphatase n=1 Tax=Chlamydomonas eustigma TaxID=1157962 RepID=A0A250XTT0_9CHLO|nr:hypothetical protein CEUSTIGMA_g13744.t1 [Chlamydomonas eustigma]|eukprot:GAX86332.1 hypothetical protein CEUSTIGMA_g13744.t1 [Chlamydomonas eustigma]
MCASKVSPFRDGLDPRMQRIGRVASAPKDLMFEMHPMHSSKTFESLCGPEIRELQKRVLFFQNNRDWYEKSGIPYQLGIMLTGECGTGKSSAIRALANVTKRNIVNVNLANVTTMTQLKNLFCKGTIFVDGCMMNFPIHERIFVLDEVDALGLGLSCMRTSADAVPDEVNLGELLTLFDGGIEVPGRIIVLITNRPERLDRALVRPGRIDLHLKLGLASRKTLSDMYEVFFEEPLEAVRMEELPHEILSPAQAVEALIGVASQGLSSPDECVNAAIAAFKDMAYQDKNDETQMATGYSVGYDISSCINTVIPHGFRMLVDTGIVISCMPCGTYCRIAPRSGLALKGIDVVAGVVDPDYRGSIKVLLVNNSDQPFTVNVGDRIAQLILERCETPEVRVVSSGLLQKTERDSNGFGSTGIAAMSNCKV